jgi:AcrR family transcriptional regulator
VILRSAEDVFARCGYHRASLDEIAHEAGVSKALIYEHFTSKRELHASLIHAQADEMFAALRRGAAAGTTGDERLRGGIEAFLGFVEDRHPAWRALFRDGAEPDAAELIGRMRREAASVVGALLAGDGEPPGDEPAVGAAMEAQLLSGALQSLAVWWEDHPEVPRAALVDQAMAFTRHGVVALRERAGALSPDAS